MKKLTIQKDVNETLLFSLIQLIYWSSNCVLYAFLMMFLREHGFSSAVCGITAALITGMGIFIHPLMGYISDTYIPSKKILLGCFAVAIPFTLVLPYTVTLGTVFIMAVTLLSFFDNYQYSMIDSWVIKLKVTHPQLDFAKIRSFGSLGYGITALIFGNIIAKFGFNIMFYAHSLLLLIVVLCILPLPEAPCTNNNKTHTNQKLSFAEIVELLLKNKRYVVLMISVCLYQFAIRSTVSFLALIVQSAGGNSANLGLITFCAAFECPIMMVLSRLIRKGLKMPYIFAASLFLNVIRLAVLSFPVGIEVIIAMQFLGAIAAGIFITCFTQYISLITPPSITATATTVGTALTMGIGGVVGSLAGGYLIEWYGIHTYLAICCIVMLLAFITFLPSVFWERRQAQQSKTSA